MVSSGRLLSTTLQIKMIVNSQKVDRETKKLTLAARPYPDLDRHFFAAWSIKKLVGVLQ